MIVVLKDEEYGEREVSVLLDSKESDLVFIDHPCVEMSVENSLATYEPHACVVVYSVTDRRSFEFASEILRYLWQEGTTHERSVILVGNKCDLARARVISSQGQCENKQANVRVGLLHAL
ncbi:GTP-binding protein REM 2 [Orchesella cincta]|uniref:GTP-binding protein REM 2 n=1 Tax=Orchesella cincta TaxID=48709 RepID=A0A1D2MJA4_ORCCI|nr:GTP-binding protein REM 2 [Orchesella cincta]